MPGGFSIAGDAIGAGVGAYETIEGMSLLKHLESQPMPEESVSPELQNSYNLASQYAGKGYTAEEKGSFQAQESRAATTQYNQAAQEGGINLANTLRGQINEGELMSFDKFAAQDAEIRRQSITNLGTAADKIQEQKNRIQDERVQHRNQLEQAYGGAIQAGLGNIMKSFSIGGAGGSLTDYSGGGASESTGPGSPSQPAGNSYQNIQNNQNGGGTPISGS